MSCDLKTLITLEDILLKKSLMSEERATARNREDTPHRDRMWKTVGDSDEVSSSDSSSSEDDASHEERKRKRSHRSREEDSTKNEKERSRTKEKKKDKKKHKKVLYPFFTRTLHLNY